MYKIYDLFLSIQHFLVMYAGAVVIPLIVGNALHLKPEDITFLISADLLTSGIATLLYTINTKYIGVGLPVVLGASFNSLAAFITIGSSAGLPTVYGSIIISGLFIFITAPLIGPWIKRLPPIITGIVITVIGLSLIPIAFDKIIDPHSPTPFLSHIHTGIFILTLVFIFLFQQIVSSSIRHLSILLAIILFSVVFYLFNVLDMTIVKQTPLFHLPALFYFGLPEFHWNAIITFIIILLVTSVESAGDLTALSEICEQDLTTQKLTKSFRSEGLATILGGFFNAFTYSNFAQNIGLIQMTGIKKVSVVQGTGIILILLSFFPQIAAITTLIPSPVLGAAMLTMFGMIITSGLKILSRVNFSDEACIWTLALSLGFGVGIAGYKGIEQFFPAVLSPIISNPIVMTVLVAIVTYYSIKLKNKLRR